MSRETPQQHDSESGSPDGPAKQRPLATQLVGLAGRICFPLLVIGYLLPQIFFGLNCRSPRLPDAFPKYLFYFHNTGCLFNTALSEWTDFYMQGKSKGSPWSTLDDEIYSPMVTFGHISRLDRILLEIEYLLSVNRKDLAEPMGQELADWLAARHQELEPTAPPLRSVRFVTVRYPVGGEIAMPLGHWRERPFESSPPWSRTVLTRHSVGQAPAAKKR
ncbi:MAG: hypothetical protein VX246_09320 [Myxococcota bacterium]|nr:hypothetical protein [Myxococcota bacterium]